MPGLVGLLADAALLCRGFGRQVLSGVLWVFGACSVQAARGHEVMFVENLNGVETLPLARSGWGGGGVRWECSPAKPLGW